MKILISGASGFLGKALVPFLQAKGHVVVRLVRSPIQNAIFWNPSIGEVPKEELEGFDAIIHLAGKNIATRWTSKVKEELFLSRCRDTSLLSHTLLRLKSPPKCLITASATGIYGHRPEEKKLTEDSFPGKGFLSDLCQKWEEASKSVETRGIRLVHTRFGVILSQQGGMLAKLRPLFKLGLGAVLGEGTQYFPWVALEDVLRVLDFIVQNEKIKGAVNVVSPQLVTQGEFSRILAKKLNRPLFLRIPRGILKMVAGELADEMLLASTPAFPEKLLAAGFTFSKPSLENALL